MKILIAEDEPTDRLLLQAAVRKVGHECFVAADGEAAWSLFKGDRPDVVISDCRMPLMDGTELCRRIRTVEGHQLRDSASSSYTPFIFVSGLDDRAHVLAGMEVGADDYLAKPVNMDELHARLISARRLKKVQEERFVLLEREHTARQQAERAIALRDQVLSSLSHDLKSPLTAITARAGLMRYRIEAGRSQTADHMAAELARIEQTSRRMAGWLDELGDVAQLQIGLPLELRPDQTDLVALAREVAGDVGSGDTPSHRDRIGYL